MTLERWLKKNYTGERLAGQSHRDSLISVTQFAHTVQKWVILKK